MTSSWKLFCAKIPQRWVFAIMGSLAVTNAYTMRNCLSLAITAMVVSSNMSRNDTRSSQTCPVSEATSPGSHGGGTFEWNEYTQGIILSSFFWGYIITQIPGGILAEKFGGKYILGLGIFSTAVFTIITPMVVHAYDWRGLIVLRVLIGFGEGVTIPAISSLISQWAPPHERSKLTGVVMTGTEAGSILGSSLSGVLIQHSSTGWPMAFYVFGAVSVLWFFAWVLLCYSYPEVHPFIGEKEKNYLRETMKNHTHRQIKPIPWRHILTSVPFWALLVGKFGRSWGFQMMIINLPKYMTNVLKFSIQTNGFLTALPHAAMWVVGIGSCWLADWLIKRDKMSRTNVRKMSTIIASLGPGLFILAASYAGCDHTIAVVLFTVGTGIMGPNFSGVFTNVLDLSPNYSGTLMATGTVVGSVSGILVPYTVGVLTPNQSLQEWRIVFWITFVVFCVTSLIFSLLADGEVQYWNDLDSPVVTEKNLELIEEIPFIEESKEVKKT